MSYSELHELSTVSLLLRASEATVELNFKGKIGNYKIYVSLPLTVSERICKNVRCVLQTCATTLKTDDAPSQ